jgi:ribonucleoside-triphosphate reductase
MQEGVIINKKQKSKQRFALVLPCAPSDRSATRPKQQQLMFRMTILRSQKMAKCGAKTEVYSRVCGYFRPVANWNKGKREEFKDRKTYAAAPCACKQAVA